MVGDEPCQIGMRHREEASPYNPEVSWVNIPCSLTGTCAKKVDDIGDDANSSILVAMVIELVDKLGPELPLLRSLAPLPCNSPKE